MMIKNHDREEEQQQHDSEEYDDQNLKFISTSVCSTQ